MKKRFRSTLREYCPERDPEAAREEQFHEEARHDTWQYRDGEDFWSGHQQAEAQ